MLPKLIPYVPDTFRNYHEPFLGGGAMFFAVGGRAQSTCYLSDLNDELINTWLVLQDRETELRQGLLAFKTNDSESFFYRVRRAIPSQPVDRAARFIYLNQTAWNGLWRVNRWGEFNVPWGQRSFRGLDERLVRRIQHALMKSEIRAIDFRQALCSAEAGDFVYLDPPYLPLSDTSKFHLYTEVRFREADLRELASICESLTARGVRWVLSNRDTPLIRELFSHSVILGMRIRRSVAAQNRRNIEALDSPEVIVISPGDDEPPPGS